MTDAEKDTIEEMARIICGNNRYCQNCWHNSVRECGCLFYAKRLYEQGYRKQSEGEWVEKNIFFAIYKCSICGAENLYKDGHACLSKFCPNCGAKMKGGAE